MPEGSRPAEVPARPTERLPNGSDPRRNRRAIIAALAACCGALWVSGCEGSHSALDPAGPQSRHIDLLWWWLFWVTTPVFFIVLVLLAIGVVRRRQGGEKEEPPREVMRRHTRVVAAGIGVTAVILVVLLTISVVTGRSLTVVESPEARTILVTANRWWWKVRYEDPIPANMVITANEIHIPVGQPVRLKLRASDVIHSFWVPNLHGKRDMIPGHESSLWIQADRPGVFEGQCAEFCGHQHAHMRFLVVAQPVEEFERWLEEQRKPAREPETDLQRAGREVFLSNACVMCHTVRGTLAGGNVAPDLTHVGSRRTIGAGILPNNPGHLAGWVVDSQQIKPGNYMPPNSLSPDDLHALLEYLGSLK